MAVPPEVTIRNISGIYTLNHHLSGSIQGILKQQNINIVLRHAISRSNVDMTLDQYTSADGKKHVDQTQLTTGNLKNFEERVLDWEWMERDNWIWGKVNGRSRYTMLSEIEDEWLREAWEEECTEVVEGYVESATDSWRARQVWGFALVDGVRRHVRKVLAQKPGCKDERVRLVYDWKESSK